MIFRSIPLPTSSSGHVDITRQHRFDANRLIAYCFKFINIRILLCPKKKPIKQILNSIVVKRNSFWRSTCVENSTCQTSDLQIRKNRFLSISFYKRIQDKVNHHDTASLDSHCGLRVSHSHTDSEHTQRSNGCRCV